MEQKSTGKTGTGTKVDERKSKPGVIYESMNVKGRNGGHVIQGQNDEYISCNGGSSPLMSTILRAISHV